MENISCMAGICSKKIQNEDDLKNYKKIIMEEGLINLYGEDDLQSVQMQIEREENKSVSTMIS